MWEKDRGRAPWQIVSSRIRMNLYDSKGKRDVKQRLHEYIYSFHCICQFELLPLLVLSGFHISQ